MRKQFFLTSAIVTISLAFWAGGGGQTVTRAESPKNSKLETKSTPVILQTSKSQTVTDLKKVEFENFTFDVRGEKIKLKNGVQVGACKKDGDGIESGVIWSLEKENIEYGDLDGDGRDEALIALSAEPCGGNMPANDAVLVLTIKDGRVTQLPIFDYSSEPCEPDQKDCDLTPRPGVSVSYDAQEKAIVVESYYFTEEDALCCPSVSREIWYKWDGSNFVETKKGKLTKK